LSGQAASGNLLALHYTRCLPLRGSGHASPDAKRHHLLNTSLRNLSQPFSTEPQPLRQLASENSQLQPFLPTFMQRVEPDIRLVPFPIGSSPKPSAHHDPAYIPLKTATT
jgi:hypothetical protein